MFKSKILWILLSVVTLGIGAFITYKLLTDNSNLTYYIPKNSAIVVSADFKSLTTKLNFEEIKSMQFFKKMMDRSVSNPDDEKFKTKYAQDPFATGINLLKDAYFFAGSRNSQSFGGVVFAISDKNKFETFLSEIPNMNLSVNKKDNFSYLSYKSDAYLVWNDEACYLLGGLGSDDKDFALSLINLKKNQSIADVDAFQKFRKTSFDMGLYMSFEEVKKISGLNRELDNSSFNFNEKYLNAFLNFDNNEINLSTEIIGNEEELVKSNFMKDKGISTGMQKLFTNKKPVFSMSMSLDMKRIFSYIKNQREYEKAIKKLNREIGISESEIENILNGDFSFCVSDISNKKIKVKSYDYESGKIYETEKDQLVTSMILSVSISNKTPLIDLMKKMNISNENGIWVFPLNEKNLGNNLYLIDNEIGFTMTNDEGAANELKNSKKFNYTLDSDQKELIEQNPMSMRMNLHLNEMPAAVQDQINRLSNRTDVLNELDNATLTSNGVKSIFSLKLKEGENNSLFRIFKMADKAYNF
ncbi:MAG: DUF4836 family protein [Bacteroidota bacterium]|jgi:hypothetical protein